MKRIVEISEEDYRKIQNIRFLVGGKEDRELQQHVIEGFKNSIPLNKTNSCSTCRNQNSHHGVCDICHSHRCWTPKNGWTKEELERHGK